MIIIIDGYNLLRHIFPKVKGFLDKQRQQLIKELSYYKAKKTESIQEIVVVFDGGLFGHASREVRSGIVIIFAGQKSNADEWILHHVSKNKGKDILLVTLDRKLREDCEKFDIESIDVFEFYNIIQTCLLEETRDSSNITGGLHQYNHEQDIEEFQTGIDDEALALLMEQASLHGLPSKDTDLRILSDDGKKQKGNALKLSKKEKRIYSKLKKLQ